MTTDKQPEIFLIRHGETTWSLSGQHTSFTDIGLTENGKQQATRIKKKLVLKTFSKVFCSPSRRAKETCQLCGLLDKAEILDDLSEWNYGHYEGLKTAEIREQNPDWLLFRDGAPGGESPEEVTMRADRVIQKIVAIHNNVAIFSSGHFSRVLAARWIDLRAERGKNFFLAPAALSVLGWEREVPVIKLWNDTGT